MSLPHISAELQAQPANRNPTGTAGAGTGNDLANSIVGNARQNELFGLAGDDQLLDAAGDDFLNGGRGADLIDGGDGFDLASWLDETSGLTLNLANQAANAGSAAGDRVANVEAFYLRRGDPRVG
jgi:hypothetical protein